MALTWSGQIYKRHVEQAMGATDSLIALRHFQRFIARPMIVIWDRLHAPRAVSVPDDVAAHPDIDVEWLPPSAPDVNPEEGGHGHITQHLRNAAPATPHD